MPETLTERLVAVAAVFVALGLIGLALAGGSRKDVPRVAVPAAPSEPSGPALASPTLAAAPVGREPGSRPAAPATAAAAKLVLTAARGSCRVSIRRGSETGKVLFDGVLDGGRTIRLQGGRLWVRLGAAANVDLRVNGKRVRGLPGGTVDLIATRTGIASSTA